MPVVDALSWWKQDCDPATPKGPPENKKKTKKNYMSDSKMRSNRIVMDSREGVKAVLEPHKANNTSRQFQNSKVREYLALNR